MSQEVQNVGDKTITNPQDFMKEWGDNMGTNIPRMVKNFRPYLIVLNKVDQFENFVDGDQLTIKDLGCLYIQNRGANAKADLLKEIEFIVVKEEKGSELYVDKECVFAQSDFATPELKEQIKNQYGKYPSNSIKWVIMFKEPVSVTGLEEPVKSAVLNIKGGSFGSYIEQVEPQRMEAVATHPDWRIIGYDKVPVCGYSYKLSTIPKDSILADGKKVKNHVLTFEVSLNDLLETKNYKGFVDELSSLSLFERDNAVTKDNATSTVVSEVKPVQSVQGTQGSQQGQAINGPTQNGDVRGNNVTAKEVEEWTNEEPLPWEKK